MACGIHVLYMLRLKLNVMQIWCVCVASTRWESVVAIGFVNSEAHLVCGDVGWKKILSCEILI